MKTMWMLYGASALTIVARAWMLSAYAQSVSRREELVAMAAVFAAAATACGVMAILGEDRPPRVRWWRAAGLATAAFLAAGFVFDALSRS